jgi:hypothetical protein
LVLKPSFGAVFLEIYPQEIQSIQSKNQMGSASECGTGVAEASVFALSPFYATTLDTQNKLLSIMFTLPDNRNLIA